MNDAFMNLSFFSGHSIVSCSFSLDHPTLYLFQRRIYPGHLYLDKDRKIREITSVPGSNERRKKKQFNKRLVHALRQLTKNP